MLDLAAALSRIEQWAEMHAPDALENLNEPISDASLARLRALLPPETPAELYALLSIHDGESLESWQSLLPDLMKFLSSDLIEERYTYDLAHPGESPAEANALRTNPAYRVRGPVIPFSSHPGRIPFAAINFEVFLMIDLVPAPGGSFGQVILEDLEACRWSVIAPSLTGLLAGYQSALDSGWLDVDADGFIRNDQQKWAKGIRDSRDF